MEPFISHCLQIIDGYERETEEEGEVIDGDEKMGRAVQLVSVLEGVHPRSRLKTLLMPSCRDS